MAQITTASQIQPMTHDENILVVKRSQLFVDGAWQGLKKIDFESYIEIINQNKEFLPRSIMENDTTYKQIIPYLIFKHIDQYFLMQRQAKASEQRLQSKFTLGIGGHIRHEDLQEGTSIFDWARREFHEEVHYTGNLEIEAIGVLNDDSNEVGKVHIGFVLLLHGDSANISVKSELKSGMLVSLEGCKSYEDRLESWSKTAFDFLCNNAS